MKSFVNNYLDRPSMTTAEFVREGLRLARDRSQRSSMSRFIRSGGDITFYRHYHGPVYAYWIALCQALGFMGADEYRASGLILHAIVTALIFFFFRIAFPEYPPIAALTAALTFLMNRTALVTSTNVTQHVMFGVMAALTLFPLALYCRTKERRWWYLTTAALGVAFSTVETSFVLVAAVLFVLGITGFRSGWKSIAPLLWRGILIFLTAILVVWPKGVLMLGGLKGYIYLGYVALVKKTFTPIGPVALWTFKIRTYPEEFVIPLLSLIAATIGWSRLTGRQAVLPYLTYAWMFLGVTMIITAPYTYYHDSLLLSCAVITGVVFGELWRRNILAAGLLSAILAVSLVAMDVRYYRETVEVRSGHDSRIELLSYLKSDSRKKTLYVPYALVPTLHFYMPDLTTVGYDEGWTPSALSAALSQQGTGEAGRVELLCESPLCNAVAANAPASRSDRPVMSSDAELHQGPLYSVVAGADPIVPGSAGQLPNR